jgi:hypothetical protein
MGGPTSAAGIVPGLFVLAFVLLGATGIVVAPGLMPIVVAPGIVPLVVVPGIVPILVVAGITSRTVVLVEAVVYPNSSLIIG